MWLLMIFWKTFRGMWRLVIGLIIGVVLYVFTFTTPGLEWIFNGVHEFSQNIHAWLSAQTWFAEYQKWDYLVKPADRLPLILYVLIGRFIWLLFEALLFTLPYNMITAQKKTANSSAPVVTGVATSVSAAVIPQGQSDADAPVQAAAPAPSAQVAGPAGEVASAPTAPPPQGTGLESAIDKVADTGVSAVSSKLAVGIDELDENATNLERSIDEALDRIKHAGEQDAKN